MLTVGKLRATISGLPDATPVITPTHDHGYRWADAEASTALREEDGWTEDYGEETTSEAEYGKRTTVLIVG